MWTEEKYNAALTLITKGYEGKSCGGLGSFKSLTDNFLMLNILEYLSNVDLARFAGTAPGHNNLVDVIRTIDPQRAVSEVRLYVDSEVRRHGISIRSDVVGGADSKRLDAQLNQVGDVIERMQAEGHTRSIENTKSAYEYGLICFCFCLMGILGGGGGAAPSCSGSSGRWSATGVNIARIVTVIIGGLSVWGFSRVMDAGPSYDMRKDMVSFGSTSLGMFWSGACLLADGVLSVRQCV